MHLCIPLHFPHMYQLQHMCPPLTAAQVVTSCLANDLPRVSHACRFSLLHVCPKQFPSLWCKASGYNTSFECCQHKVQFVPPSPTAPLRKFLSKVTDLWRQASKFTFGLGVKPSMFAPRRINPWRKWGNIYCVISSPRKQTTPSHVSSKL